MTEQEPSFEDQDSDLEADWIIVQNPILISDPVEESGKVKMAGELYGNN
jgi:hypothetical protein